MSPRWRYRVDDRDAVYGEAPRPRPIHQIATLAHGQRVYGEVDWDKIWRTVGGRPGDRLILTKFTGCARFIFNISDPKDIPSIQMIKKETTINIVNTDDALLTI